MACGSIGAQWPPYRVAGNVYRRAPRSGPAREPQIVLRQTRAIATGMQRRHSRRSTRSRQRGAGRHRSSRGSCESAPSRGSSRSAALAIELRADCGAPPSCRTRSSRQATILVPVRQARRRWQNQRKSRCGRLERGNGDYGRRRMDRDGPRRRPFHPVEPPQPLPASRHGLGVQQRRSDAGNHPVAAGSSPDRRKHRMPRPAAPTGGAARIESPRRGYPGAMPATGLDGIKHQACSVDQPAALRAQSRRSND
jgi:hypothetical protein